MTFAKLIAQLVTAPQAKDNLLTDGQFTCTYPALPVALERIDHYFLRAFADTVSSSSVPRLRKQRLGCKRRKIS